MPNRQEKFASLRVISPCHSSWEEMQGDQQQRHCGACDKYVYDFSQMTARQIEALIAEKKGSLCGRFTRDANGKLITLPDFSDTPDSTRRNRAPLAKAMVSALLSLGMPVASVLPVLAPQVVCAQQEDKTQLPTEGEATAKLEGTVLDAQGAVIPNAKVTLKNQSTLLERGATTSTDGEYSFTNLKPGAYTLIVEANGFMRHQQDGVALNASQNLQLAITLHVSNTDAVIGIIISEVEPPYTLKDALKGSYQAIKKVVSYLRR